MRQFPIAELDIAPGHLVQWRLRSTRAGHLGRPRSSASFNQDKHFSAARQARSAPDSLSSWVAATFELRGQLDRAALETAMLGLVGRHEVLRCEFEQLMGDPDGDLTCAALRPDEVALEPFEVGHLDSAAEVRDYLADHFEKEIDTLSWPLVVMGAVVRAGSATVYFAFDHLVSDGLSVPVVVRDLATAYEAVVAGRAPALPGAGSYVAFGHEQRRRYLAMRSDDERLGYWKSFMASAGGFFPHFPLDLGVEPGQMYGTVNEGHRLLDAREAAAFEARCQAAGGSCFTGTLAAVGRAQRDAGGPAVYQGLLPVSERGRGHLENAMGWFVNTMPIEFPVREGRPFEELLGEARTAFHELLRHIDVPFVRAWQLLAPEYAGLPCWPYPVNFFSYIDSRRVPGAEHHGRWRPTQHVWASRCNGISFWFHRDADGLHVNSIYADTPRAGAATAAFWRTLTGTVAALARGED